MEKDLFPHIGSRPISEIKPLELLQVMHKIEGRGAMSVAHIVRGLASSVFRYGVITGQAERDQAGDIQPGNFYIKVLIVCIVVCQNSLKRPTELIPFLGDDLR